MRVQFFSNDKCMQSMNDCTDHSEQVSNLCELVSYYDYVNAVNCKQPTHGVNNFTASCENAMTLSVPGVLASCEKFPHSSQLNFWSTESIFNPFSVFLKPLNALFVCLQYKHPRSMKRVIRSDNPVTLLLLLWSHKCDIGAEPRSCIFATSAVKGLIVQQWPRVLVNRTLASQAGHNNHISANVSFTFFYKAERPPAQSI
jgi:hypothetical protein